jgi:hypothetical protein
MVLIADGDDLGMAANIEAAIADEIQQEEAAPNSQDLNWQPEGLAARVLRLTRTFISQHMLK